MTATNSAVIKNAKAKSVEEEPFVRLTDWLILHAADTGQLHFVGRKPDGKGRISSPIAEFDLGTMTGKTLSGRCYKLEGRQAVNNLPAAIILAKVWGEHMIGHVRAVPPEAAVLLLPAWGNA